MITLSVASAIKGCNLCKPTVKKVNDDNETAQKVAMSFAVLETFVCIGAIVLGYLIHSNALPSSSIFDLLRGRMQLATVLMGIGTASLVFSSIFLIKLNCHPS